MSISHLVKVNILAALLFIPATSMVASPVTFDVTLNTSSLVGLGAFSLAFQLTDGSGAGDANNTVSIYNFAFHGGSTGTVADALFGGATGNLSSAVALTDSSFFNALVQSFIPGPSLSFWVTLSNNADGGSSQDMFALSLLDGTGSGIPTLDPSGSDTLLTITLDGSLNPPSGAWGTDPQRTTVNLAAASISRVPEPKNLLLLGGGFAVLTFVWLRRLAPQSDSSDCSK